MDSELATNDAPARAPLLPLVERVRAQIDEALRALLGLPAPIALRWRQDGSFDDHDWNYVIEIGEPDAGAPGAGPSFGLELSAAALKRPAFLRGSRLHVAHRAMPADAEPLWQALVRRLRALDAGAKPELLGALQAAQRRFAPFVGRADADFREYTADEALLRIGFRCNQDCSFCWQGRDWPEPDLPTLQRWLDQMAQTGARHVVLSGGEPTLYLETLLALARHARDVHGLPVFVQTNAIRLRQPHVLEALIDAGVIGTLISYHSSDAALSDAITRAPGTHQRTEQGIRAAVDAGLLVDLNVVVERRTLPGLVARSRRIVEAFLPAGGVQGRFSAAFSFPTNYHDPAIYRAEVAPLDEVAPILAQAIAVLQGAGVRVAPVGSCGFPLCALAETSGAMDFGILGGLMGESLSSRQFPDVCDPCQLRGICVGPRREYLEAFGNRGLQPFLRLPPDIAAELQARGL